MIESQRHSYHLVDPSPWPISGSLGALATTVGGVMYMHSFQGGATLLSLGLIFILYTMFVWWRDVLRESTLEGHHTKVVQLGPRYGFILFIVSEVMFFFAFFRASSHSSLAPTVEIGGIWPPKGIGVLDPWEIPFLNTLIPLSSGAAVTWAHHAILAGKEKRAVYALVATVLLALVFTGFQGMEYYQAPSTISDSIYGSTFFLATGFHGFHVIIGTLFSIICGIRQYLGHLTKEHHVGFEAAAWVAGSPRRGRSDAEGPEKCSNPVADPLVGDGAKSSPVPLGNSFLCSALMSGGGSRIRISLRASMNLDLMWALGDLVGGDVNEAGEHPNQQLKKEFRCQFHTLYHKNHKKVVPPTFRSTGYRSMAYTPSTGFGSLSDDKDAGSTVDSNPSSTLMPA
ncbi:unnamed protein product [Fraxinus pennsylvanica]|uniref:Cytochrome c oxidase subunit 3 n=1 Tax=Fraxinus pennsylvanica TaxID=56036 RepID=A0AAD1ZUH7_9LAMI|nr:unnamed protein product [Fraxinus pennsylvanica]